MVTSRFLYLIWNPPLPEDQNGVIIRYTVNISVLVTMQMFQLFTDNNSIMVSSLRPYTTYSFTIAAETAVGVGPFSGTYMVMTATDGKKHKTYCKSLLLHPPFCEIVKVGNGWGGRVTRNATMRKPRNNINIWNL